MEFSLKVGNHKVSNHQVGEHLAQVLSCRKVLPKTWSSFLAEPPNQPFPFFGNTSKTLRQLMFG
ncbi:MAG: hypothetical protein LBK82_06960 [Planctomycetaceae bacterium]|nr:hypothetical protein [Planctomycetaceae bacterium]